MDACVIPISRRNSFTGMMGTDGVSASVATPLPALLGLYPAELPSPVTSLLLHGRFVATKPEFRIIALSNVADACAGLAILIAARGSGVP